jgi:hypothetical protein
MKKVLLLLLFAVSVSFTNAQYYPPYSSFVTQNVGRVDYEIIRVQTGDPIYYLDQLDGAQITTYILTDWQGSVGNVPTVFGQGWSLRVTYSPCDKTLWIRLSDEIRKVRDANYNEYIRLE